MALFKETRDFILLSYDRGFINGKDIIDSFMESADVQYLRTSLFSPRGAPGVFRKLVRKYHTKALSMMKFVYYIQTEIFLKLKMIYVIFQKRVRVFHRGFKHEKTDESTRPQAECFYCFRVFETPMKHEARVFEITSLTKEN